MHWCSAGVFYSQPSETTQQLQPGVAVHEGHGLPVLRTGKHPPHTHTQKKTNLATALLYRFCRSFACVKLLVSKIKFVRRLASCHCSKRTCLLMAAHQGTLLSANLLLKAPSCRRCCRHRTPFLQPPRRALTSRGAASETRKSGLQTNTRHHRGTKAEQSVQIHSRTLLRYYGYELASVHLRRRYAAKWIPRQNDRYKRIAAHSFFSISLHLWRRHGADGAPRQNDRSIAFNVATATNGHGFRERRSAVGSALPAALCCAQRHDVLVLDGTGQLQGGRFLAQH